MKNISTNTISKNTQITWLLSLFMVLNCVIAIGQTNNEEYMLAEFDSLPTSIVTGEAISKVLKIINTSSTEQKEVWINVMYPAEWKLLGNKDKSYLVPPLDTFFIPIRLIPRGIVLGNTSYLINAYVVNDKNVPITSANFFAKKPKIIDWDFSATPSSKIYLKNDETETSFDLNLFNKGNENQEFTVDLQSSREEVLLLMDTSGTIIKNPSYTFELEPKEDSTFHFRAGYIHKMRNHRLINIYEYIPNTNKTYQKYSIYANSRESALTSNGSRVKGKRIDIISLPDNEKVNEYSSSSLPLTMNLNFSNLLGVQPMMNALFTGNTRLKNGALLTYQSQSFLSVPYATSNVITSSFFNIGYYTKKYNVTIGNVGGYGGGGRGISGAYNFSNYLTVGAFVASGPRWFSNDRISYGVFSRYRPLPRLLGQSSVGQMVLNSSNIVANMAQTSLSYQLLKNHTLSVGATFNQMINRNSITPSTSYGYTINGNYGIRYLKSKFYTSIGGSYNSMMLSNFLVPSPLITANHRTVANPNKRWSINLDNSYQHRDSISSLIGERTSLFNTLSVQGLFGKTPITPALFYNVIRINSNQYHSRGVSIGTSNYESLNNRLVSLNLRTGYNKSYQSLTPRNYFFFQSFLMLKYRVWSANLRYLYGSLTAINFDDFEINNYPKVFAASINNQYQFKNTHFILNTNLNYRYIAQISKHTIGITPQFYYFTNNGWQLFVTPGYYMGITTGEGGLSSNQSPEVTSRSLNVNAGIRKEFGIPIPWSKQKHPTITFQAFMDHNGNNVQDEGEISLENVVVRFGKWEVLTNYNGRATMENVFADSTYTISAFSLQDVKGYFPNIPSTFVPTADSVFAIPFVKGIKVYGRIYVDRETASADAGYDLNLSSIRVSALNHKDFHTLTDNNGYFTLYVPYGEYKMYMDESVTGSRFTLVQNNIPLELDRTTESVFVTFYLVEKRRRINVKKFGSSTNDSKEKKEENELPSEKLNPTDSLNLNPDSLNNEEGNNNPSNTNIDPNNFNPEDILTPEVIAKIIEYLQDKNVFNINNGSDYDGITPEEWKEIEALIRKIHNEDGHTDIPSPLPDPVKLEVDEVNFTNVLDMYERKLNGLDQQISSLEQQLSNASTPEEKARIQAQLDQLKQQRELIDRKHDAAQGKLQDIRNQLADRREKEQEQDNTKQADFDKNSDIQYQNGIPMDEPLPDGLVYRVQIGVFSKFAEQEAFKGLYPLAGRTMAKDKYSYETGIFYSYDQANEATKDVRDVGLGDAFIIAYYNGKHISVSQALRLE